MSITKMSTLLMLRRQFFAGMLIVVPVTVTAWVVIKIGTIIDNILGRHFSNLTGHYLPGLGALLLVFLVWLAGVLAGNIAGRWVVRKYEEILLKMPIIKMIFSSVKQIMDNFVNPQTTAYNAVALVNFPLEGCYCIGFITNRNEVRLEGNAELHYHVFIPTPPNPTAGFLALVPVSRIKILDLPLEEAFKLVLSGGMVNPGLYRFLPAGTPEGDLLNK